MTRQPAVSTISSDAPRRSHVVPLVPLGERADASHLPNPLTALVGREHDVAKVVALLHDPAVRLVTLTGPGGVGKTRLALEVAADLADEFADSVAFVDLAAVRDPELVVPTIVDAFGLHPAARQPAITALTTFLRDRTVLLVLDNFEQVVEAGPRVTDLLQACPRLTVLATSRARLHVSGEHAAPVLPLALPREAADGERPPPMDALETVAAVRLFVERARAVESTFALTNDNAAAVITVVRRLDGLPLTIELAAARSTIFTPVELLARLEYRLPQLTGGPRDQPARLQTMRDAIAWSYDLLAPVEQTVFRCLSAFVGGCTLAAAEAVCGGPDSAVIDAVESLTSQSLVQAVKTRSSSASAGATRLVMLETIREFATDQLAASGDQGPERRHAAFFRNVANRAERTYWGDEPGDWRVLIDTEQGNLRAALTWAIAHDEADTALDVASAMFDPHWVTGAQAREQGQWLRRALALPGGSPAARVTALVSASSVAGSRDDLAAGRALAEEALDLAIRIEDEFGIASASTCLGTIALHANDVDEARRRLLTALAGFRRLNHQGRVGWTLCDLAWADGRDAADEGGDSTALARALGHFEEALALFREIGDTGGAARALHGIAYVANKQRDLPRALDCSREVLALDWGQRWPVYHHLENIADVAERIGRPEVAAHLYGAADAQRERLGRPIEPFFREEYERDVALARAALGEAAFAAAWNEGRALPLDQAVAESLAPFEQDPDRRLAELTRRERQILERIATGKTNRQIADELFISFRTVEYHVSNLLAKLGMETRAEAAILLPASPPAETVSNR